MWRGPAYWRASGCAWAICVSVVLLGLATRCVGGTDLPADPREFRSWADAQIRRHRSREVTLSLRGPDGPLAAGLPVHIEMVRPAFLFGTSIPYLQPWNPAPTEQRRTQYTLELFNYAVIDFMWRQLEPAPGRTDYEPLLRLARWCREQHVHTLGHHFVWHFLPPDWLPDDPRRVEPFLEAHTRDMARMGRDLVDDWVAINESAICATPHPSFARSIVARWVREESPVTAARKVLRWARPEAGRSRLMLNEWDRGDLLAAQLDGLRSRGSLPDIIGIELHLHDGEVPLAQIWQTCERFAAYRRPLQFTEVTVLSGQHSTIDRPLKPWPSTPVGEARQAAYAERLYRGLFAHPAVEGIVWWNLADDRAWLDAPAGLLRTDLSEKPAYTRIHGLIRGEWWTRADTTVDRFGIVRFRAFYGHHRIRVTTADGTVLSRDFDVTRELPERARITLRTGGT